MTGTIREVRLSDARAIADIYNYYIEHTTVTYETEPVTAGEMERRIRDISEGHPYLVYEDDGVVTGYCYAHPWKVRAAYRHTFETTIYLDHRVMHHGIGRQLMARLTDMCRERGCHVLIERLKAIYHTRIQYPELKKDDDGAKADTAPAS